MATDLVCGMIVNPASAPARTTYAGDEYSFCATYCKEVFEKDPQKFIHDSKQWSDTTDPVCGMQVDPTENELVSLHKGRKYYFCAPGCREAFPSGWSR